MSRDDERRAARDPEALERLRSLASDGGVWVGFRPMPVAASNAQSTYNLRALGGSTLARSTVRLWERRGWVRSHGPGHAQVGQWLYRRLAITDEGMEAMRGQA